MALDQYSAPPMSNPSRSNFRTNPSGRLSELGQTRRLSNDLGMSAFAPDCGHIAATQQSDAKGQERKCPPAETGAGAENRRRQSNLLQRADMIESSRDFSQANHSYNTDCQEAGRKS